MRPENQPSLGNLVDFEKGIVWIKRIGPRRADDRIDAKEVAHGR